MCRLLQAMRRLNILKSNSIFTLRFRLRFVLRRAAAVILSNYLTAGGHISLIFSASIGARGAIIMYSA